MASVSGEEQVTRGAVEALAALVSQRREESASAPGQDAAIDQFQARIADLEAGMDRATGLRLEAVERCDDEQVERAIAEQDRSSAERRLRYLQQRFAGADTDGVLWDEHEPKPQDVAPASLEELLARLRARELKHVVFTGDESPALGLDEHDLAGTAARKAWEAILALDDYAARSLAGLCPTDVDGYLQQTPAGCRGFSAARHARGESEDVRRNRRYAGARVLPVPREVDPSGTAEMWAHFKLTQSGMTSPRLHYHDATATTGTVYVGYLGPHLPTGMTN